MYFPLLSLLFFLFQLNQVESWAMKRFVVNLDDTPFHRWDAVIDAHKEYLPMVAEESKKYIPAPLQRFVWFAAEKLVFLFPKEMREELEGIAHRSGLPLGEIVGMNILYDISAFDRRHIFGLGCTSIVARNKDGRVFLGRNLDYEMGSLLKKISVYVDFKRNNRVVYSGITFALYNGLLTGQRPLSWGVSLNARYNGPYIENILMELYTKFRRPVSYFIREVLETTDTYEDALEKFADVHLISPSYIILAGTTKNQGAVISRNRWSAAKIYTLDNDQWFLVETNYDNWQPQGDDRRVKAISLLKNVTESGLDTASIGKIMGQSPILNNLTIFTTVIEPVFPSTFAGTSYVWGDNR